MQNFWMTRLRLEKVVYKKHINVALQQAEDTNKYRKFKSQAEKALLAPTKVFDEKRVYNLLLLAKTKAPEALISAIGVAVSSFSFGDKINIVSFLLWGGEKGGQAFLDKLEIEKKFKLKNSDLHDYFENHKNLLINSVDETTKKWIARQIQAGKDEGLTAKEIARVLHENAGEMSRNRAEQISITELASAMAKVEAEAAYKYGIKTLIWRTSFDCIDPVCLDLEGKKAPVNGSFSGGYLVPAHPRCRCFYEEEIPDEWVFPDDAWLGE